MLMKKFEYTTKHKKFHIQKYWVPKTGYNISLKTRKDMNSMWTTQKDHSKKFFILTIWKAIREYRKL